MPKQTFYVKLIPPRASFATDMDERERGLMMQHVQYFGRLFSEKRVLIYGPVMGAHGSFGMGVLQVESEAEAREILESDPTVTAGLNRFEISPMRLGGCQAPES